MRLVLLQSHEHLLPTRQQAVLPNRLREVRTSVLEEHLRGSKNILMKFAFTSTKKDPNRNCFLWFQTSSVVCRSFMPRKAEEKKKKASKARTRDEAKNSSFAYIQTKRALCLPGHSHWISPLTPHATAFCRP